MRMMILGKNVEIGIFKRGRFSPEFTIGHIIGNYCDESLAQVKAIGNDLVLGFTSVRLN
jgi:hypothetical protein